MSQPYHGVHSDELNLLRALIESFKVFFTALFFQHMHMIDKVSHEALIECFPQDLTFLQGESSDEALV